ncbi:MAG: hypothetical protein V2A79_10145 [Planctomycetota bacterium]
MTETKDKPKHPGGRPTKYKAEFGQMLLDYIDQGPEPWEEYEETYVNRTGQVTKMSKLRAKPLRFIGRWAQNMGISHETLLQWAKEKPEFSEAYSRARQLQAEHILAAGMMKLTDPMMSKFAAVNMTDLSDKQDIRHEVSIAPPLIK